MKRILILLMVAAVLLLSCTDGSSYINYTWDDSTVDADSDGIPDIAEVEGTSFYGLPLYDWGARQGVPDLFVHVAPMEPGTDSYGLDDAGMLLQKKALDKVVAAFAAQGIALHFDVGSKGLYAEYIEIQNRSSNQYNLSNRDHTVPYNKSILISGSSSSYSYVSDLRSQYLPSARDQIFYFMVMGSSQLSSGDGGSSGLAELGGRNFLITLGNWGLFFGNTSNPEITSEHMENQTVNFQASTIMHEFGHNLGLRHGGDEDVNFKPNYYSIMNYLYQLNGLSTVSDNEGDRYKYEILRKNETNTLDDFFALTNNNFTNTYLMNYSHGEGNNLDQQALIESEGLRQLSGTSGVDWNLVNGITSSPLSYNINAVWVLGYDSDGNKVYEDDNTSIFHDYDDWNNLSLYYADLPHGVSRTVDSRTYEIIEEFDQSQAVLDVERR